MRISRLVLWFPLALQLVSIGMMFCVLTIDSFLIVELVPCGVLVLLGFFAFKGAVTRREHIALQPSLFRNLRDGTLVIMRSDASWFVPASEAATNQRSSDPAEKEEVAGVSVVFRVSPGRLRQFIIVAFALSPYLFWAFRVAEPRELIVALPLTGAWIWQSVIVMASAHLLGRSYDTLSISFSGVSCGSRRLSWDSVRSAKARGNWLTIETSTGNPVLIRLVNLGLASSAASIAVELIEGGAAGFLSGTRRTSSRSLNFTTLEAERPRSRWLLYASFIALRALDGLFLLNLFQPTEGGKLWVLGFMPPVYLWPLFIMGINRARVLLREQDSKESVLLGGETAVVAAHGHTPSLIAQGVLSTLGGTGNLGASRFRCDWGRNSRRLQVLVFASWLVALEVTRFPSIFVEIVYPIAIGFQLLWLISQRDLVADDRGVRVGFQQMLWRDVSGAHADGARLTIESSSSKPIRLWLESTGGRRETADVVAELVQRRISQENVDADRA